ncbi:MAG: C-GCAxxG-C-C family protein [Bacillota bacterium]
MDDLFTLILKRKTRERFRGSNCAETVLGSLCDVIKPETDARLICRLGSGFSGGIGQFGCLCGALSGGILALGMFIEEDAIDTMAVQRASRLLTEKFADRFGDTCCRLLNGEDFTSLDHFKRCYTLTSCTAVMTLEYLMDNNLVNEPRDGFTKPIAK